MRNVLTAWIFLTTVILVEGLLSLLQAFKLHHLFTTSRRGSFSGNYFPRIALLAPCKGVDPNFQNNLESWVSLQYPNYKIFFIVESPNDPALDVIRNYSQAELLIAGLAKDSGQKIHNLRYAIQQLPDEYEVLVFVDSDARVNPEWLNELIGALKENQHGGVTGYRWFVSPLWNFAGQLRAVWNSGVLTLYTREGKDNFFWGGAMAVLRRTFLECEVFSFWKGSVSDDYQMTSALKSKGRTIRFVPGAMARTEEPTTLRDFLRWAYRQLLITRIYNRKLWAMALLYHAGWLLWVVGGIALFPAAFVYAFSIYYLLEVIKAEIKLSCIEKVFAGVNRGRRLFFWVLPPLIACVNFGLIVATMFSRTIQWRGRSYVLHGKNQLSVR